MAADPSDEKAQDKSSLENDGGGGDALHFLFRGKEIPVTYCSSVSRREATMAVESEPFKTWYRRCERSHGQKQIEIHSVYIQSVDLFGPRGVGFVKLKSHCTLVDGETHHEHNLPGICFIRGNAVSILVALHCEDKVYSLLVDQPRVPIGQVSCLELPAGMLDDENETLAGTAVKEMEEECDIHVHPSDLVDLTELACKQACSSGRLPVPALASSPGGCDEFVRYLYLEKRVTEHELDQMKGKLMGLREHGEFITLTVVPMDDVWKKSGDPKAMISLFLCEQLRKEGKLPPPGELATPLTHPEPVLKLNTGVSIPQLAFGLYKVPATEEGEQIILNAVKAGYRHFDTASFYENEATLGRALKKSRIPREQFFLASKVWNTAIKGGRAAVRKSVEKSLADLDFGGYYDLFMVHWPVPGFYLEAYKELEKLHHEGRLRALGISNFNASEYKELVESGVTVPPAVNQVEVSPMMYRPDLVTYFVENGFVVSASKALHRAMALDRPEILQVSEKHSITPAQVMLRWGVQKGLIVVAKTSNADRMRENRSLMHFALSEEDVRLLDSLTTEQDIRERDELETKRKSQL